MTIGIFFGLISGLLFQFTQRDHQLGVKLKTRRHNNNSVSNHNNATILCWVPIAANGTEPLVALIRQTWGRHCDLLLLTSEVADVERNIIKLNIVFRTPQDLWNIVHPAWQYVYETYVDQYDWFVKVDSDSYFQADNFRHFVRNLDHNVFHYLGHQAYFKGPGNEFNLGAGYAISRQALKQLGPALPLTPDAQKKKCSSWKSWAEDLKFAECLRIAGMSNVTNSRDPWERERFMAWYPTDNFVAVRRSNSTGWFWKRKPKDVKSGIGCCSSRPVLFHQLKYGHICAGVHCQATILALEYMLVQVVVDPKSLSNLQDDEPLYPRPIHP